MKNLLTVFIVIFGLVSFAVGSMAAQNAEVLNHPKLFKSNTNRLIAIGLPQGETRAWRGEIIPGDDGNIIGLCLKNLTGQRIFPAAGPAVGGGMFCLSDLVPVGPFQLSARVVIPTDQKSPTDSELKKFSKKILKKGTKGDSIILKCSIFIENEIFISRGTASEEPSRQHVVTCPSENGQASLMAEFSTQSITEEGTIGVDLPLKMLIFEGGDSQ